MLEVKSKMGVVPQFQSCWFDSCVVRREMEREQHKHTVSLQLEGQNGSWVSGRAEERSTSVQTGKASG